MYPTSTLSRSIVTSRSTLGLVSRTALAAFAATLLAAYSAHGQSIPVLNNSFENPVVPPPAIDPEDVLPGTPTSWSQATQPGYYSAFISGGAPAWNQTVGVFGNTSPFITNLDGIQAAYILNFAGNSLYQSLSTNYTVGTPYTVSVGIIGGSGTQSDDSIDLILYYQSGGNMIPLADTTVVPSQSSDLTNIKYFTASMPAVQAGAPEVGQPIGVEMVVTNGVEGGFWDVDNVQMVPEPATIGLLAFGLGALGLRRRRRVVC
jgi:hypothetical protein